MKILPFTQKTSNDLLKTMIEQDEKGMDKYGKELNPMDDYDWLDMAQQEIADLVKYVQAEKVRRNIILDEVLHELTILQLQYMDDKHVVEKTEEVRKKLTGLYKEK